MPASVTDSQRDRQSPGGASSAHDPFHVPSTAWLEAAPVYRLHRLTPCIACRCQTGRGNVRPYSRHDLWTHGPTPARQQCRPYTDNSVGPLANMSAAGAWVLLEWRANTTADVICRRGVTTCCVGDSAPDIFSRQSGPTAVKRYRMKERMFIHFYVIFLCRTSRH